MISAWRENSSTSASLMQKRLRSSFRRLLDTHALAVVVGVDHALLLGAQLASQHGRLAGLQCRLEHIELIRVDRALYHHLSQPVAGGDEYHVAESRFGVQREQHARGADIRAHHQLHAGGQEHLLMGEAVVDAIGNGAVVVQRGEHLFDRVQHILDPRHVEEGFLLTGKTGVRQVLGGGRRAHGDIDILAAGLCAQPGVGLADGLGDIVGQGRIDDPAADLVARCGQRVDILDIQVLACAPRSARSGRYCPDACDRHRQWWQSRPARIRPARPACRSSRPARHSCRRPVRGRPCQGCPATTQDRSRGSPPGWETRILAGTQHERHRPTRSNPGGKSLSPWQARTRQRFAISTAPWRDPGEGLDPACSTAKRRKRRGIRVGSANPHPMAGTYAPQLHR